MGTACFGLTHALVDQQTKVLFVVPTFHGGEPNNKVHLISASDITVPRTLLEVENVNEVEHVTTGTYTINKQHVEPRSTVNL